MQKVRILQTPSLKGGGASAEIVVVNSNRDINSTKSARFDEGQLTVMSYTKLK